MLTNFFSGKKTYFLSGFILVIVLMMILPIPTFFLDLFLALNISLALAILLTSLYVERPLEFSSFPVLLLISTLFRLSMNVASTRLILMNGSQGTDAAGQVIQTFGNFVAGGSYLVGVIIFIILVLINFVVITKGSGRIAEVAARFTLDSLPGKQMSIDADLNAGLITEEKAKQRRQDLSRESDFYGSMDGASKFVRGDAIAGLLITLINIIGGLVIGITQQDMELSVAASNYTILTIGDGLVSQIPSLVISTSAGLVVTRAASGARLGDELAVQLWGNYKKFYLLAVILGMMALLPGMPSLIFICLAIICFLIAQFSSRKEPAKNSSGDLINDQQSVLVEPLPEKVENNKIRELLELDMIELSIGYNIVEIADKNSGGDLLDRVKILRRNIVKDLGFIIPPIHIHDDLALKGNEYSILLKGEEIGRWELMQGKILAIDSGVVSMPVDGISVMEPAFGLPAKWIMPNQKDLAELAGYLVVDHSRSVVTHLSELVKKHASELLTRQDVQGLLDNVAAKRPQLVDDLVPKVLTLGNILKILKKLLKEDISIRDLPTILETLSDYASVTKNTDNLTEFVRQNLARSITSKYVDDQGVVNVLTLGDTAEELFRRNATDPHLLHDPTSVQRLLKNLEQAIVEMAEKDMKPVLLTTPDLRCQVKTFFERFMPQLNILSYKEIDSQAQIRAICQVGV